MTLLFITQKIHAQDAFAVLWVRAFERLGYTVKILCLEAQSDAARIALGASAAAPLQIYSMGKEHGIGRFRQILNFWRSIVALRYDRVFIHMSPVWFALGWPVWMLCRTPVYLWYTHYKMQLGVRLFWLLPIGKRLFCATVQSLPRYPSVTPNSVEGAGKKVVVGHGIDLAYWPRRPNQCAEPRCLLGVYRLSRSKRVEICLRALAFLPQEYTWDIYGIEAEPGYVREMRALVRTLGLEHRVTFHDTVPAKELSSIYARHCMILNMASETIDKTMLEAMTCGCYPVTTARNAEAIGLRSENYGRQIDVRAAPQNDTPEAVAAFIRAHTDSVPMTPDAMYRVVTERHSLAGCIAKMNQYIRLGQ